MINYTDTCQCEFCAKHYEQPDWNYKQWKYCSDSCRANDAYYNHRIMFYEGEKLRQTMIDPDVCGDGCADYMMGG